MITIADAVAAPELGLRVVSGHDRLDVPITSAHVSELVTPHEWLRGGELLMTVGLLLEMDEPSCIAYLENCQAGGVAAVALGLGAQLPYQECPPPLRRAADLVGVPLLEVPGDVPFIAVTKWVFATMAEQERRDLEAAMSANRRLTQVATASTPLAALLDVWAEISDADCVVTDGVGRVLARTPGTSEETTHEATDILHKAIEKSAGSLTGWSLHGRFEIHTVGDHVPLAYVILGSQMNPVARHSSTVLVSLLALEVERRHVATQPERQRRASVFGQLMRSAIKPAHAQQLAESVGWKSTFVQVAVIKPDPANTDALVHRLRTSLSPGLIRVHGGMVEIAHPESDQLIGTISALAPGLAVGVGTAVRVDALAVSATQARSLVLVSEQVGRVVSAAEGDTVQLLLGLAAPRVLRGFADSVLAPLDQLDGHERIDLLRTLEEWLRVNGAWDPAAARLSLHRNTVRNRIARISTLTGRHMDNGDDRMELWLALKARAAAPRG